MRPESPAQCQSTQVVAGENQATLINQNGFQVASRVNLR